MSEKGKRLEKEQMIDVITSTALRLEAKLLVLHDSYNIYHKNYSPEALELYSGFSNYSDAVHRMIKSGQLGRLPSELLKKLLEYSLDVSDRLNLGVRVPTNQKNSKEDETQSDVGNINDNLYAYGVNNSNPDESNNLNVLSQYHMTGNTTMIPNSGGITVSLGGCAITLVANVSYSAGDTLTTPTNICTEPSNFADDGSLIWNNPLPSNVSTTGRVGKSLTVEAFNNLDNGLTQQYIGIKVQYKGTGENPSSSPHWVGCNGVYTKTDGLQYFIISPTSDYDTVMGTNPSGNNRGGLGWENVVGVGTIVPVNRCTDYIVFRIENNSSD